ncbi:MAG: MFS transporter small subunit [Sporichthyaceae bacterium]
MSELASTESEAPATGMDPRLRPLAVLAWLWVLIPFGYGIAKLVEKIPDLF